MASRCCYLIVGQGGPLGLLFVIDSYTLRLLHIYSELVVLQSVSCQIP